MCQLSNTKLDRGRTVSVRRPGSSRFDLMRQNPRCGLTGCDALSYHMKVTKEHPSPTESQPTSGSASFLRRRRTWPILTLLLAMAPVGCTQEATRRKGAEHLTDFEDSLVSDHQLRLAESAKGEAVSVPGYATPPESYRSAEWYKFVFIDGALFLVGDNGRGDPTGPWTRVSGDFLYADPKGRGRHYVSGSGKTWNYNWTYVAMRGTAVDVSELFRAGLIEAPPVE